MFCGIAFNSISVTPKGSSESFNLYNGSMFPGDKVSLVWNRYVVYKNEDRPDIVHDLNACPFPFEDNSVNEIIINSVLQYLDNIPKIFEELYRIMKPDAVVHLAGLIDNG